MIIVRILCTALFLLLTGCGLVRDVSLGDGSLSEGDSSESSDRGEDQDLARDLSLSPSERLLPRLPPVPVIVTREVEEQRRMLLHGNGATIIQALNRSEPYRRELIRIFNRAGVPLDLLNVPIVESGFNRKARGPQGSVGIWQFSSATAKHYGLSVGFFRDERKDPILSTRAAAAHFRDLYHEYRDWYLALAAYNAGTGRINRAISQGGSRNFWSLAERGFLPPYTRKYVPRFLAATVIVRKIQKERRVR